MGRKYTYCFLFIFVLNILALVYIYHIPGIVITGANGKLNLAFFIATYVLTNICLLLTYAFVRYRYVKYICYIALVPFVLFLHPLVMVIYAYSYSGCISYVSRLGGYTIHYELDPDFVNSRLHGMYAKWASTHNETVLFQREEMFAFYSQSFGTTFSEAALAIEISHVLERCKSPVDNAEIQGDYLLYACLLLTSTVVLILLSNAYFSPTEDYVSQGKFDSILNNFVKDFDRQDIVTASTRTALDSVRNNVDLHKVNLDSVTEQVVSNYYNINKLAAHLDYLL